MTDRRETVERQLRWYGRKVAERERQLAIEREQRRELALTLLDMGLSEREVAGLAGVSGSAVHQWKASA